MDALVSRYQEEAEREADGEIRGLAVATVTDNKDTDGLARVRVRLPWQPEGEQSYWARLATPMAMGDRGMYFLPDIGDEVLVGFARGNMSHPFVIGSLWNGQRRPPQTNDDGKNDRRLIRSRSGHELRFEDGDPPTVELKLQDGKHLLMNDKGVTLEDGRGNTLKIESNSGSITIESTGKLRLKAQTISIEAGASMELKASGTLTLKGALVQIN
ncbi:MAG: phage baseplate assembly protein V [Gammaproteobacteria bacterium]